MFEVSGVREGIEAGRDDTPVTMLTTQYRMAAPIAEIVSQLAYDGRLRTAQRLLGEPTSAIELRHRTSTAIVVMDTSGFGSRTVRDKGTRSSSRANPLHAMLAVSVAEHLLAHSDASVGLITPYRAQAKLLHAASRVANTERLVAATIHRFQGSERDVVIFDLVDGFPESGPSQLTGRDAEMARRLLNVALSRARAHVIVVVNRHFATTRLLPGSVTRRVLDDLERSGDVVTPDIAWLSATAGPQTRWLPDWEAARHGLASELGGAGAVFLNLPPGFDSNDELRAEIAGASTARAVTIAAPFIEQKQLEHLSVRLPPQLRDSAFVAVVGSDVAYIGGADPARPIGRLQGRAVEPFAALLSPSSHG